MIFAFIFYGSKSVPVILEHYLVGLFKKTLKLLKKFITPLIPLRVEGFEMFAFYPTISPNQSIKRDALKRARYVKRVRRAWRVTS